MCMTIKGHAELVGSEKVERATGRPREEWHELLDAAGATNWTHRDIAAWLVAEHGVEGWWAQGLTVGYEQARGMRVPGQRPDGTFDANASKTIARGADEVFAQIADDAARESWLGAGWHVASATVPKRARLEQDGGARVLVEVTSVSAAKVRVAVQHVKLADPGEVAEQKAFWKDALSRLAAAPPSRLC